MSLHGKPLHAGPFPQSADRRRGRTGFLVQLHGRIEDALMRLALPLGSALLCVFRFLISMILYVY